jgi:hypothetical protein
MKEPKEAAVEAITELELDEEVLKKKRVIKKVKN